MQSYKLEKETLVNDGVRDSIALSFKNGSGEGYIIIDDFFNDNGDYFMVRFNWDFNNYNFNYRIVIEKAPEDGDNETISAYIGEVEDPAEKSNIELLEIAYNAISENATLQF